MLIASLHMQNASGISSPLATQLSSSLTAALTAFGGSQSFYQVCMRTTIWMQGRVGFGYVRLFLLESQFTMFRSLHRFQQAQIWQRTFWKHTPRTWKRKPTSISITRSPSLLSRLQISLCSRSPGSTARYIYVWLKANNLFFFSGSAHARFFFFVCFFYTLCTFRPTTLLQRRSTPLTMRSSTPLCLESPSPPPTRLCRWRRCVVGWVY